MAMELTKKNLYILFLTGLLLTLLEPVMWPSIPLAFFIPFIVTAYYQKSQLICLWLSLICGVILDIIIFSNRMGLWGVSYCVTTLWIYKYRMHFFGDRQSTLPIMTFFFALISTMIFWCLNYVFDKSFIFSLRPFLRELLLFPFLNAVFAYFMLMFPMRVYTSRRKTSG
jgi:hypothetical protein